MRWSHGILCTLARWTVEFSSKIVWFVLDTAGSLYLYHIHCNVVSLGKSKKIIYSCIYCLWFCVLLKNRFDFSFSRFEFFFFPFPFSDSKTKTKKGLFSTTRQCSIERWHCKIRLHCCQCCNIFNSIRFEWFFFCLIFDFFLSDFVLLSFLFRLFSIVFCFICLWWKRWTFQFNRTVHVDSVVLFSKCLCCYFRR